MEIEKLSLGPLIAETSSYPLDDIYGSCFALILHLRATDAYGDADILRQRIHTLLNQTEREALRVGHTRRDVQRALFALVAFLDETILASGWTQKAYWMTKPLQAERYDCYNAGEVFFEELEQLRVESPLPGEVLEVYYLCLALGFKGKYKLHGQDQHRMLIEEVYAQLARASGPVTLSPHGRPRDSIRAEVSSALPSWIILAGTVMIALLIYLGMQVYISNLAEDTAAVINQAAGIEATR